MLEVATWQKETILIPCLEQNQNINSFADIEYDVTPVADQIKFGISSIYWHASPFTQTELLGTQDYQVQLLILYIRKSTFISNHEIIASKLLALFNTAKEENPACPGIEVDSLLNFHNFLKLYKKLKIPTLSLSPDYNIYASWKSNGNLFSIHFLLNDEIRFVLFKPNKSHLKQKNRITGTATNDALLEIIAKESLSDWVFHER